MLLNLTIEVKQTGNGFSATINGLNQVQQAATAAGGAGATGASATAKGVAEAYVGIEALRTAFESVKGIAEGTIGVGVRFNAEQQKSQLLLAALISNYQAVYDAQGHLVPQAEKFNTALTITQDLQGQMVAASVKYGISYESISQTAQTVLATSQGQVKSAEQLVELSVKLSKVGALTGMQPFQIMRDVRDMMTIGRPTELSMMLGISAQDIQQAKASGDIVEMLNQKLNVYMLTAQKFRDTIPGALGALHAGWEAAMGAATKELAPELVTALNAITDSIVTVDKQGRVTFNENLMKWVKDFADLASKGVTFTVTVVKKVTEPGGVADTLGFFGQEVKGSVIDPIEHFLSAASSGAQSLLRRASSGYLQPGVSNDPFAVAASYYTNLLFGSSGLLQANSPFAHTTPTPQQFGPPANLAPKPHFGQGAPKGLTEEQQKAIDLSKQRVAVMETESDIAQTQLGLAQQKTALLGNQVVAETAIRGILGLQLADQQTAIAQLGKIYQLADQAAQAQATAQKAWDDNQKAFDEARGKAIHAKDLTPDQRAAEIDQALQVQRDKDNAVQAQLTLALAQNKQAFLENERQITASFLAEVEKRTQQRFVITKAALQAQFQYEGAWNVAENQLYANTANDLGKGIEQALSGAFTAESVKKSIADLANTLKSELAKYGATGIERYLAQLQAKATGQQFYDPQTQTYRFPTAQESKSAGMTFAGIQSAAALYGIYSGSAGMSKTAGTLSGAASGAMAGAELGTMSFTPFGPILGAVVGALIGGIAGNLGSGTYQKKFDFTVTGGKISYSWAGGDAQQWELNQYIDQLNSQIATTSEAGFALISAFPVTIATALAAIKPGSVDLSGSFRNKEAENALKNFITVQVPEQIFTSLKPVVEQGMSEIGISQSKINEMFATAATMDPTKAFQFMTDYVTAFVTMKQHIDFLSSSASSKTLQSQPQTVPQQLATFDQQLALLATGFDQLTGQQQVDRAKQINDLLGQRQQLEQQYLLAIANTMKAITTSYNQILTAVRMQGEGSDQQFADLYSQRSRVALGLNGTSGRHGVAGATTPEQVQQIADSYSQLTQQMVNLAVNLRDQFETVLQDFAAIDTNNQKWQDSHLGPQAQVDNLATKIFQITDNFSQLSSDDKLAKSRELIDLANQYYDIQHQTLDALANEAKNVHESIQQQIFGVQLDQLSNNPQAQINMLLARNRDLYGQLAGATTSDQIDAIQNEIRSNAQQVYTLSGKTPDAAQKFLLTLGDLDKQVGDRTKQLGIDLQKSMDPVQQALSGTVTTVTGTIDDLGKTITNLQNDLTSFLGETQKKLGKFTDDLTSSDQQLFNVINPIFLAFGGNLDNASNKIGDISAPGGNLDRFRAGLDSATTALARFADIGYSNRIGSTSTGGSGGGGVVIQFQPRVTVTATGTLAPLIKLMTSVADDRIQRREIQVAQRRAAL